MTIRDRLTLALIRALIGISIFYLPLYGTAWLILGHPPVFWHILIASEALETTLRITLTRRRRREIRDLQAQFDRPAYGD